MTVEAYAKINLTLEVLGCRPDGYHDLRSVVQPIAFSDTLEIETTADGSISSDTGYGEADLIVQAARHLRARAGIALGARIRVTKRIPAGGGLGGGSADAAAALLALNGLWGLSFSPEELAEVGAEIGSDVPALVLAQQGRCPVLMEGRGEHVSRLPQSTESRFLILANPGVSTSTAEVYAAVRPRSKNPSAGNDLEEPACRLHPEISAALAALRAAGAADVAMTGSGSTVFGFADSERAAQAIALRMADDGHEAWVTQFLH